MPKISPWESNDRLPQVAMKCQKMSLQASIDKQPQGEMKYQKHRPREVIISSLGRNEIPKYCPRDVMINGLGRNEMPEISPQGSNDKQPQREMKYQKHRPREVIMSSLGRNEIPKYCSGDVMINGLGRNEIPDISPQGSNDRQLQAGMKSIKYRPREAMINSPREK